MFPFIISIKTFLLFCLSITFLIARIPAQVVCPNTTTFAPNSTYQTNLDQLLSSLSSNVDQSDGFYNTTIGQNNPGNTIYGLFLCRGDVTTQTCQDCVTTATKQVPQQCPNVKEAVIWQDECLLRYSNQSFFSKGQTSPMYYMWNSGNVTESEQSGFTQLLADTMRAVAEQAANGEGGKKFATKEANFTTFQNLYTLGQCTPDLSAADCNTCLQIAISNLPNCCDGKKGGRVNTPSCYIRYELYPFYQDVSPAPVPTPELTPKGKGGISATTIVVIVVLVVLAVLLFLLCCWFITRRQRKKYRAMPKEIVEISSPESLQYDLETIQEATNNFSDENKLGEGGFGEVYKGLLPNGQNIAVKRLSRNSRQGAEEFKNEAVLVAKLQHRNLVRLLGFCLNAEEKILIYEYVPNKSLDHILFDPEKQQMLNWPRRYKIIEGISRGMLYLHEDSRLRIIHRDLKVSNILLDEDLNPKVSDFGMARIFGVDQTQGNTSRIAGTYGYMSPEYAMHGEFSVKSDVYSFGVLVLEIITGKKNTSFHESGHAEDLLSYAWKKWRDGNSLELLDMTLRDSYSEEEVTRCIHIGLLCVQEDPVQRPTMQTIALMLNSHSVTVAAPESPAFFVQSRMLPNFPTTEMESDKSTSKSTQGPGEESLITQVYGR